MTKTKKELQTYELLSNYIRIKVKNNLGSTVGADEFNEYLTALLNKLNNDQYSSWEYIIKEESFDMVCQKVLSETQHTNLWGRELEFVDSNLVATYGLYDRDTTKCSQNIDIKNFLSKYIGEKSLEKESQICECPSVPLTKEQEVLSKKIAAYVINDLMDRYVYEKIEKKQWPEQCRDVQKYILENDLASAIDLEGTRNAFLNVYTNAVRVVGQLIIARDSFQISNNSVNVLAFSHFLDIVGPYQFIRNYIYNPYEMQNRCVDIKVENGNVELKEVSCVFNDMYDGDDEFATKKPNIELVNYNKLDTLSNGIPLILQKVPAK